MYAPGDGNPEKSSLAPYRTGGSADAEFNECAAFDQSRTNRSSSCYAIGREGRILRSGGREPSAYQWILPGEASRPSSTAARSRSSTTEGQSGGAAAGGSSIHDNWVPSNELSSARVSTWTFAKLG